VDKNTMTDLKQKLLKLQRWLCTPSMSIYAEGNSGKIRLIIDGYLEAIEALEFYADVEEWIDYKAYATDPKSGERMRVDSKFDHDEGSLAKQALAKAAERLGKL
jgi:hypothetical protein